jgi:hypothetical protein
LTYCRKPPLFVFSRFSCGAQSTLSPLRVRLRPYGILYWQELPGSPVTSGDSCDVAPETPQYSSLEPSVVAADDDSTVADD